MIPLHIKLYLSLNTEILTGIFRVDDEIEDELSSTDEEKESEDSGGSTPNVQDEKVENCQVENKQDEKNILEKESTNETAENGCKNDNVLSETSKKDEKE